MEHCCKGKIDPCLVSFLQQQIELTLFSSFSKSYYICIDPYLNLLCLLSAFVTIGH